MVGGLLVSQVLTLYTTPVIYIFFDNLGHRFSRKTGNSHPSEPGSLAGDPDREQGTGNSGQGTGNREQGTGNSGQTQSGDGAQPAGQP
jgi:hypothetical protein